jgi:protein-S-isoprenylcysteine O-methyltransferase Ste14
MMIQFKLFFFAIFSLYFIYHQINFLTILSKINSQQVFNIKFLLSILISILHIITSINPNEIKKEEEKDTFFNSNELYYFHLQVIVVSILSFLLKLNSFHLEFDSQERIFLLLAFLFLGFRYYSIYTLGKYFTFVVTIKKDHKLIDYGPYRYLMHPSYTGSLFGNFFYYLYFGYDVLFVLLLQIISYYMLILKRIPLEEEILLKNFGNNFLEYKKNRWRIIPFLY